MNIYIHLIKNTPHVSVQDSCKQAAVTGAKPDVGVCLALTNHLSHLSSNPDSAPIATLNPLSLPAGILKSARIKIKMIDLLVHTNTPIAKQCYRCLLTPEVLSPIKVHMRISQKCILCTVRLSSFGSPIPAPLLWTSFLSQRARTSDTPPTLRQPLPNQNLYMCCRLSTQAMLLCLFL